MRKVVLTVAVLLVPALSAMAADNPRVELFGGYTYQHSSFDNTTLGISGPANKNLNGWDTSFTFNVNKRVGLVADFSGDYGKQFQVTAADSTMLGYTERPFTYSFLFGPRFYLGKGDRIRPFAEGLFGGIHAQEGIIGLDLTTDVQTDTAFATALGGGLDVQLKKHIELRAIEADYLISRLFSSTQNNVRISTGIIFRIGHVE